MRSAAYWAHASASAMAIVSPATTSSSCRSVSERLKRRLVAGEHAIDDQRQRPWLGEVGQRADDRRGRRQQQRAALVLEVRREHARRRAHPRPHAQPPTAAAGAAGSGRPRSAARRSSRTGVRPRAVEVEVDPARREARQRAQLAGERRRVQALGVERPQRADRGQPPARRDLLVLLRRGVGDDERGQPRAQHLERRVVAALADRAAGGAQLVARGRARCAAAHAVGVAGPALEVARTRGRAGTARRSASWPGARRRAAGGGRRAPGSAAARPRGRRPPTRRRGARAARAPGRGGGRWARRSRCSAPAPPAACAGGTSRPAAPGGARHGRASRRSSGWRCGTPARRGRPACRRPRTRMSRRLQATSGRRAPQRRASDSNGTSSAANFARPNGNSSTSTTSGTSARSVSRAARARRPRASRDGQLRVVADEGALGADAERRQRHQLHARGQLEPVGDRTAAQQHDLEAVGQPAAERERAHQVAEADRVLAVEEQARARPHAGLPSASSARASPTRPARWASAPGRTRPTPRRQREARQQPAGGVPGSSAGSGSGRTAA